MSGPLQPQRRPSVASQSFYRIGDIREKYEIKEVIGTGNYAEVRRGINKLTGEEVAVKIIVLSKDPSDIMNEIDILARVDDHPHVVQLKEIYEQKGRMYIVMELVTGGELFDRIIARQHFNEQDARDLMHVLIETVSHMHSYGIVHRDLKPENVLFASKAEDAPIKIADFGLAKLYQPADDTGLLQTLCGTPGYVAPEVLKNKGGYTPQCDMWSLGVILYIVLCGYPPFQHEQQNKLFKQILRADFHFHSPWWDKVSDEAKDIVCRLLVVDPARRLTPKQAMQHPWMQKRGPGSSVDVDKLQDYVRRINKRKFRMLKNAIVASRIISEIASGTRTSGRPAGNAQQSSSVRAHDDSTFLPPPPPPPPLFDE